MVFLRLTVYSSFVQPPNSDWCYQFEVERVFFLHFRSYVWRWRHVLLFQQQSIFMQCSERKVADLVSSQCALSKSYLEVLKLAIQEIISYCCFSIFTGRQENISLDSVVSFVKQSLSIDPAVPLLSSFFHAVANRVYVWRTTGREVATEICIAFHCFSDLRKFRQSSP